MTLADVKKLLNFTTSEKDSELELIISLVEKQLKNRLGGVAAVPAALEYITTEVAILRFNRIDSEGLSAEQKEGYSATYNSANLFRDYEDDIAAYLAQTATTPDARKLRFL